MTKCYECEVDNCKNPLDIEGGIIEGVCPDGYHNKVVCENNKECKLRDKCIHGSMHDPFTITTRYDINSGTCKDRGMICDGISMKCI